MRRLLLALALLVSLARPSAAAIAFDTSASTLTGASSTWSHTCTCSLLFIAVRNPGSAITSVTYAGVSATQIQSTLTSTDGYSLWYLVSPATGSNTVAVNGTGGGIYGISVSYSNTGRSAAIDVSGTNPPPVGTATITMSLATTTANDWTIGFVFDRSGSAPTANSGCTSRVSNGAASMGVFDSNAALNIGANSMVVNEGATSAGSIQAAFKPAVPSMLMVFQ